MVKAIFKELQYSRIHGSHTSLDSRPKNINQDKNKSIPRLIIHRIPKTKKKTLKAARKKRWITFLLQMNKD